LFGERRDTAERQERRILSHATVYHSWKIKKMEDIGWEMIEMKGRQ
jgi:hypothetical protein